MMILMSILIWTNTETAIVDYQRIENAVRESIDSRSNCSHDDMVVEFRSRPLNIAVPVGEYSVRVPNESTDRLKGYVSIPVEIICQGKVARRLVVSCHIRTFGNVVVAARDLKKNESLDPTVVVSQRVETTTLPDDVLVDEKEVAGYRTARMINAHSILRKSTIEKVPVLRQNDVVTIEVNANGTRVTGEAIAKQDGNVGELIAVQRVGTHQRLKARVVDGHRVEIRLDKSRMSRSLK